MSEEELGTMGSSSSVLSKSGASLFVREALRDSCSIQRALALLGDSVLREVSAGATAFLDVFPQSAWAGSDGGSRNPHELWRCIGMVQEVEPNMMLYCGAPENFFSAAPNAPQRGNVACSTPSSCGFQSQVPGPVTGVPEAVPVNHPSISGAAYLQATQLYVIPVPGNRHFYLPDWEHSDAALGGSSAAMPEGSGWCMPDGPGSGRKRGRERDGVRAMCASYSELNLPHAPVAAGLATSSIVTVLHTVEGEHALPRLNEVIEFYGFVEAPVEESPGSEASADMGGDDHGGSSCGFRDTADGEWKATTLGPQQVSRITCIAWRRVFQPGHSPRPLLHCTYEERRVAAVSFLSSHLCQGDHLAAEYLLLHLAARVVAHSTSTPIGDLPLLIHHQALQPAQWSRVLRDVVPVGEILLDLNRLSASQRLLPVQDYEENTLRTGLLQVARGTHVTVVPPEADAVLWNCNAPEREKTTGGSSRSTGAPPGGNSTTPPDALFAAIHKQKLVLEYPYGTFEVETDLGFLALSRLPPSCIIERMFQFTIALPLEPAGDVLFAGPKAPEATPSCPESAAGDVPAATSGTSYLSGERAAAAAVQHYLMEVRRLPFIALGAADPALTKQIGEALCSMAASHPGWNNQESFIHNNTLSAVMSLMSAHAASRGRLAITWDDALGALELEQARYRRIHTPATAQ